jgi:alkanesulfonate monooxygenase SsuD/methylene tetrahydromethanopterin reductase-like flavin-dependent oxidoreductase (luciferase family)
VSRPEGTAASSDAASSDSELANPVAGFHFGIALPQAAPEEIDVAASIRRFAGTAERLGFAGVWTRDRIQGREPLLEPLMTLATASPATQRIRLGVAVIIAPLRSPVELARTTSALDRLSNGRLELGLGLGADRERARGVGLDPARRVGRLLDTVDILRSMWAGDAATLEGRTLSVERWTIRPTPAQARPRIWFGGHHPDALRRAVTLGDGWIEAGSSSFAAFHDEIARVRDLLAEGGRDERTFGLGKRLYLAVERRGRSRAEETRAWFASSYGRAEMADDVAVVGPPKRIVEAVLDVHRRGGRLVILDPVPDPAADLHVLAHEVVPAGREALAAE